MVIRPGEDDRMTMFLPSGGRGRRPDAGWPCVMVCPGGGYRTLAPHEADPIALWLTSLGVAAGVLRYRVGPENRHPAPLDDARDGIRAIRAGAGPLGIDAKKVGVLGFSAGGHLAATLSTHYAHDPTARPDLTILCYAVISMRIPTTHGGSRDTLLGENAPDAVLAEMSADERVSAATPPAFLWHGADDDVVHVENAYRYASACARHRVPAELHVFERTVRHGIGLGEDVPAAAVWTNLCATWLKGRGF